MSHGFFLVLASSLGTAPTKTEHSASAFVKAHSKSLNFSMVVYFL